MYKDKPSTPSLSQLGDHSYSFFKLINRAHNLWELLHQIFYLRHTQMVGGGGERRLEHLIHLAKQNHCTVHFGTLYSANFYILVNISTKINKDALRTHVKFMVGAWLLEIILWGSVWKYRFLKMFLILKSPHMEFKKNSIYQFSLNINMNMNVTVYKKDLRIQSYD